MKDVLLTAGLLLAGLSTQAQNAPSTTKQFCRVYTSLRGFGSFAQSIEMAYGQESKKAPTVDSRLAEEAAQLHTYDSEAQAYNYLNGRGWELVGYQVFPVSTVGLFQRVVKP
ncbi:hypothetical protein GCM10027422_47330 [Hymenobacter arcticus]